MTPLRSAPPPRLLVWVSGIVLLTCTVLAVRGALTTGITTDEPIHVMRLRNYLDTGWYALDWDFVGTHPGADGTNTYVYAPVAMLLLHGWSVLWGVEGPGEVATTPWAYDVRHLGVVALALVGLAATGALGRLVLGRWRWGLVAAACLAAVPMWTGHSMYNVKDVPVATGSTLVTLGLACLLTRTPPTRRVRVLRVACLVAGLVLTLGTRPGMWPGVLAALVIAVVALAHSGGARSPLVELGGSLVVSAAILVGIYPNLFAVPSRALSGTAEGSARFAAGEPKSRWYVPLHLLEELPLLLLALVLVGAALAATSWWVLRRTDPVTSGRLGLVGVQAFALPACAVLLGTDLYHGLRQLLFLLPAAAVLMAVGVAWWTSRPRGGGRLALGLASAAMLLPVVDQVTLQPYQATYVNAATDVVTALVRGPDVRLGQDYWRASLPELVEGRQVDQLLLCKAKVDQVTGVAAPYTDATASFSTGRSVDCREEPNGPLAPYDLAVPALASRQDGTFDAVFPKRAPANCRTLDEVVRHRHGFPVVLTVLARCSVRTPELTAPADAPEQLWLHAVDGWWQGTRDTRLTTTTTSAKIVFASRTCSGPCRLVITGDAPPDLLASVAGRPTPVRQAAAGSIEIDVPRSVARQGAWVTLTRRSGGVLGMAMSGLWIDNTKETPS